MGLLSYLKSTILSKWVMAITGCILVLFICGHAVGNLQILLGSDTYNTYAAFLQGLGEILWIIRIGLFVCLVLHLITSIRLKLLNNSARPTAYQYKSFLKAKLTSRTMIWTGIMIFAFLTYHLLHFTAGVTNPVEYDQHEVVINGKSGIAQEIPNDPRILAQLPPTLQTTTVDGKLYAVQEEVKTAETRHDVYKMVVLGFRNPITSLIYIIGVILLGFHLSHAIQSMFQTAGFNHPKYTPWIIQGSNALAVIVVLCLISIPITILTGLVGGTI